MIRCHRAGIRIIMMTADYLHLHQQHARPPLQALVGTAPFPAGHWLFLLAWTRLLLLADEARKAWARRRERGAI